MRSGGGDYWWGTFFTAIEKFRQAINTGLTESVTCVCYGLRSGKRALADQMNRDLQSRGIRVNRISTGTSRRPRVNTSRAAQRTRVAYQRALAKLGRLVRIA